MTERSEVQSAEVCARLGMSVRSRRWGPCPVCRSARASDGRPPLRTYGRSWWCNACNEHGDSVDLVSYHLLGRPGREAGSDFRQVRTWLDGTEAEPKQVQAEPELAPPPRDEIVALFRRAVRAHEDPQVSDYLRSRGIRPSLAPAWALPRDFRAGWWWRDWSNDYRLVVPAWGPRGDVRSMHARAVTDVKPKSRWPYKCASGATLFGDRLGRAVLRGDHSGVRKIYIVEGLTDFLTTSSLTALEGISGAAVLAVESGSAPSLGVARIPEGIPVYVGTHPDAAGDGYADAIGAALLRPCYRIPLDLLARRAS